MKTTSSNRNLKENSGKSFILAADPQSLVHGPLLQLKRKLFFKILHEAKIFNNNNNLNVTLHGAMINDVSYFKLLLSACALQNF